MSIRLPRTVATCSVPAAASEMDTPPRHLRREQAAAYVGVGVDTFDWEVTQGIWPPGRKRGKKGGLLTWDRRVLDAISDGFPEAAVLLNVTETSRESALDQAARNAWQVRLEATSKVS